MGTTASLSPVFICGRQTRGHHVIERTGRDRRKGARTVSNSAA